MAGLSQNDVKAIRAHPLRKGLEAFRTTFKSRYLKRGDVNLTEIIDHLTSEASDTGEETIDGSRRLLIGDSTEGYHTRFHPGASGSACCSKHTLTDWKWTSQR